jgi:hypothetical protein
MTVCSRVSFFSLIFCGYFSSPQPLYVNMETYKPVFFSFFKTFNLLSVLRFSRETEQIRDVCVVCFVNVWLIIRNCLMWLWRPSSGWQTDSGELSISLKTWESRELMVKVQSKTQQAWDPKTSEGWKRPRLISFKNTVTDTSRITFS